MENDLYIADVEKVKKGTRVCTDDGFTRIAPFKIKKVQEDANGLYITCNSGHHYLDGQLNDTDTQYVGLKIV